MANPNDATTVLNAGSGGDSMDETLVTQVTGTAAKRARVSNGFDDGSLQTAESEFGRVSGNVADFQSRSTQAAMLREMRRHTQLLKMLVGHFTNNRPTIAEIDSNLEE